MTASSFNITTVNAFPTGKLPDSLLDRDFEFDLRYNQGIELIRTRYDQWSVPRTSLETMRAFFYGELVEGTIWQQATDSDRATLIMMEAVLDDRLRECYNPSKMAMCRFLRSQGIAFDASSFAPIH